MMTDRGHKLYVYTLATIVVGVTIFLISKGSSYYTTELEERFYHDDHQDLKPSGLYGHGLGIIGTLLIVIGVFGYMARKRWRSLSRIGVLKYWLEFHIFLCTLGPIMVLFHTAFKFGGIVSISFWSMVAVVASGVLGRFIYLQIPRTLQGRELSLGELQEMKTSLTDNFSTNVGNIPINEWMEQNRLENQESHSKGVFRQMIEDYKIRKKIKSKLEVEKVPTKNIKAVLRLMSQEMALHRKIQRLVTMQKYFRYWHVAHLPFAIIMLVIMIIHVAVSLTFGYTWIF